MFLPPQVAAEAAILMRAQIEALQRELTAAAAATTAAEGRNAKAVEELEARLHEAIRVGSAEIEAIDYLRGEVDAGAIALVHLYMNTLSKRKRLKF